MSRSAGNAIREEVRAKYAEAALRVDEVADTYLLAVAEPRDERDPRGVGERLEPVRVVLARRGVERLIARRAAGGLEDREMIH